MSTESAKANQSVPIFNRVFRRLNHLKYYLLSLIVVCLVLVVVFPLPPQLPSAKIEDFSFTQALNAFTVNSEQEIPVNPVCQNKVLDHGVRTAKVIVLFHGFTNCPEQYSVLTAQLWNQGYTVVIPRLPYHGNMDRLNTDLARLTSTELLTKVNQTMSVARALGEEVQVMRISAGAVLATWAAVNFDISKAVVIAPLFTPHNIPMAAMPAVRKFLAIMPNLFSWWDEDTKDSVAGPNYAYPRYSTKAALAFFEVAENTLNLAQRNPPENKKNTSLHLVLTENDQAINNQAAKEYISKLSGVFADSYRLETFESGLELPHDVIDPNQTKAKIDVVYPRLLGLLK